MNVLDATTLELKGTSSSHEGVTGQVKFDARVKVQNNGGTTTATASGIDVAGADEAVLFVSIATNFVDYETLGADEVARASQVLEEVEAKPFEALLDDRIELAPRFSHRWIAEYNGVAMRMEPGSLPQRLSDCQAVDPWGGVIARRIDVCHDGNSALLLMTILLRMRFSRQRNS